MVNGSTDDYDDLDDPKYKRETQCEFLKPVKIALLLLREIPKCISVPETKKTRSNLSIDKPLNK